MAKMTNRIKEKIVTLRTNTKLSIQNICDVIEKEDNVKITRAGVNKFLKSEHIRKQMANIIEPDATIPMRNDYLDITSDLQDIKGKCVHLLKKSLHNLLELQHPEDNLFAISRVLNDIMRFENQKENQYNKLKFEIEKFEFEKSKTIIEDIDEKPNYTLINDVGINNE